MNRTSLPDKSDFSLRARIIRFRVKHLQLTMKEAAKEYGITFGTWSAWEAQTRCRTPKAHPDFLKLYEDILLFEGQFIKK